MAPATRPRLGFVLERSLGHITHADNLHRLLPQHEEIDSTIVDIEYEPTGWGAHVPVFRNNWTIRAGVRARRAIHRMQGNRPLDALFVHTQVPAVLATAWLKRCPNVVSLDATPLQYDELGVHYNHE